MAIYKHLINASRRSRRGSVVVLVAVCLTLLLVFAAIAIEGGGLLEQRRKTQSAADAAALAAAESLFRNYPANKGYDSQDGARSRALAIAAANGFNTSAEGGSTVDIRTAPQTYLDGPYKDTALPPGYVEVIVKRNQPRYFSAIISSQEIPITARAVARGKWAPAFVGIHVLDLHASGALRATGGGTGAINGGAAVIVNSDAADAAITTGGSTLQADNFSITGGTSGEGFIGEVHLGAEPQPDPLRNIPAPVATDYATQSTGPKHFSNGNRYLQPGVYRGGITLTGQANVYMAPGVYYIDGGGFTFSGQGNLVAPGVMIYNDPKQSSDNINLSGSSGGSVTMSPPTSGVYKGLTLFQNRTATNTMDISGNGGFYVTGTFYTAGSLMNVTGNGNAHVGSQYISRFLDLNGTGALLIDYNPDQVIPRRVLGLVE
jgi:Flp pilus assembly protein TadG